MADKRIAIPVDIVPDPATETPQAVFDYHRTIVGYHGTDVVTAFELVDGKPFGSSANDDDWLGQGIYFWEYAPQQAWAWARRRYPHRPAVIGAMIRLGRCLDLLDPGNIPLLEAARERLLFDLENAGKKLFENANTHKYLNCAVFNNLYVHLERDGYAIESTRAVFVPIKNGKMPRIWPRSGVFSGGHIQLCVRQPLNIIAVWPVRKDGRYGKD